MNQKTFSFPQIINRTTGKIELSEDAKSINECLGVLLRTRPGELLGDPEYGCNLITRIFQYNGVVIDTLIVEDILEAVNKFEPRITMSDSDIQIIKNVDKINIYIQYLIKDSGEVNSYNLEVTPADNPDRI